MILKAIPTKQKNEFELIDDIRVLSNAQTDYGPNYFIYQFPMLPARLNKIYFSKQEKINLFEFTCTCEKFKENAMLYQERDIRKACKHIYYKASADWLKEVIDPITIQLLKAVISGGYNYLYKVNIYKKDYYFILNPHSAWVKVIIPVEENICREFHYHTIQKRWGYSSIPENDIFVVDQINSIIKSQLPVEHPYKVFSEIEKY